MADRWNTTVLERLKERDAENSRLNKIVSDFEHLWEEWGYLNTDRTRLEYERNQLQGELLKSRRAAPTSLTSVDTPSNLEISLKQNNDKLLAQTEELTVYLRKNAELSNEVNSLSKELAKKDDQLTQKEASVRELTAMNQNMKVIIEEMEKEMGSKNLSLQTIKDEHDVLQKAYDSLEAKNKTITAENERVVSEVLTFKHQTAADMNTQLKLEKEIQELKKKIEDMLNDSPPSRRQAHSNKFISSFLDKLTRNADAQATAISCDERAKLSRVDSADRAIWPKTCMNHVEAHGAAVNDLCFSDSGLLMATGGFDNTVRVWESAGQNTCSHLQMSLRGCTKAVNSVQFSSDEHCVLCASNDNSVRIWSTQDQRLRHHLTGHSNKVLSAKYLHDGSKVISGSHDRTLILWDLSKGQRLHTFMVGSSCNDIAVGYGLGCMFISGHFDKRVRLWDEKTKSSQEIVLDGKISSVDVSSDGNRVLCCCLDNTLRIIDLRKLCVLQTLQSDGFMIKESSRAHFSLDGVLAAAGSSNGSTFVWDCNNPSKVASVKYDDEPVYVCSWHTRGQYFVSAGKNQKVTYWVE